MTLVFTTSNRIEYFVRTIQSLVKNCTDLYLLEKVIVIDDSSPLEELKQVQKLLGYYFLKTSNFIYYHNKKSHFYSIKILFELINDEFIFLCEDDWLFINKCDFISKSLDILSSDKSICQVILSWGDCFYKDLPEKVKAERFYRTKNDIIYYEWYYDSNINHKENFTKWEGWPNFSLNPSIINFKSIKEKGLSLRDENDFEYKFALNYTNAGFKSAVLPIYLTKHIGEISAYNINKSQR